MAEPNSGRGAGSAADAGVNRRTGAERTHTPGGEPRQESSGQQSSGQQSSGVMGRIKDKAATTLESQKQRATDSLGGVAEAVRNSSEQLRSKDRGVVAGYVDEAADQIDRLSQRLKEKDVRELTSDAQRFARRHPAAFVGSAFALGVATARFLKSSAEEDDEHDRYENRSFAGRSPHGGYAGQRPTAARTPETYRSAPGATGAGSTSEFSRSTAGTGSTSESYRGTPGVGTTSGTGSTSENYRGASATSSTSGAGGAGTGTTPGRTEGTGTNKRS